MPRNCVFVLAVSCYLATAGLIADPLDEWRVRTSPTSVRLRDVAFDNGRFIAVGDSGTVLESRSGGLDWTVIPTGITNNLWGLAFGSGKYLACGDQAVVLESYQKPEVITQAQNFRRMAFGGALFVAVSNDRFFGEVYTSPDGVSWSFRTSGSMTFHLNDVAYGGDIFVAVGGDGVEPLSSVSHDGIGWSTISPVLGTRPMNLAAVTYGDGKFVAGGVGLLYSQNGLDWAESDESSLGAGVWSVAFGGGTFVAVGNSSSGPAVLTSSNAVTWIRRPLTIANDPNLALLGAAYGDSTFVAVGDSGTIVQSSPIDGAPRFVMHRPQIRTDGMIDLAVDSPFGVEVSLEASTDMVHWSGAGSATNSDGVARFTEFMTNNAGLNFFRAKMPSN